MANIFTTLLTELPWFKADEAERREDDEQALDDAEQAAAASPKPYVPKTRPEWLSS